MLRKFIVLTIVAMCLSAAKSDPQQRSSEETSGRFFDLGSLLGVNRYPRPPYYGSSGGYPGGGMYPGAYGGAGAYPGSYGGGMYPQGGGMYPQGGYGTNFIGNGYGGMGGNNGLDSYYGYQNTDYRGGGNLGYGYYTSDVFANRNTQPQSVPTGYRGYN